MLEEQREKEWYPEIGKQLPPRILRSPGAGPRHPAAGGTVTPALEPTELLNLQILPKSALVGARGRLASLILLPSPHWQILTRNS